jgi:tetratricopeptide (TPR) repeat protein
LENKYEHVKLLHEFKNYSEVINYTDQLINAMPDDNSLLVMRAEAFSKLNYPDKALECWNRIIELKSEESQKNVDIVPDPDNESHKGGDNE